MMKQILLLTLLLANTSALFSANPIDRLFTPKNNDSRVIGLSIAGGGGVLLGLYIIKKGIDLTTSPSQTAQQESTTRYIIDKFSNACSRLLGLGVTICGSAITVGSAAVIIGNKDIITQFEKMSSGLYEN